jgi:formylglycine-generating enzyme required for sulfatase activity
MELAHSVYHNHPKAGAHAAAQYFLKQTQTALQPPAPLKSSNTQWHYLKLPESIQGLEETHLLFVQIPAGSIPRVCNNPDVLVELPQIDGKIDAPFWMGSSEVLLPLFETFRKSMPVDDLDLSNLATHAEYQALVKELTPAAAAAYVDLYQSMAFCNWLSKQLGYEEVYERDDQMFWRMIPQRVGFRLPTWEEAVRAQRAESTNKFYFGDSRARQKTHTEGYWKVTETLANQYPPNGFGLFDMSGNVSEWITETVKLRIAGVTWMDQGFQMGGYRSDASSSIESANTTGIMAQTKLSSGFRLVFTGGEFTP